MPISDELAWIARIEGVEEILRQIDQMAEEAERLQQAVGGADESTKTSTESTKEYNNALAAAAAGAGLLAAGIGLLQSQAIQTGLEFERLGAMLKTQLGSESAAQEAMAQIAQMASTTPMQVKNITEAYISLNSRGFEPTMENLRLLGDLATSRQYDITQFATATIQATVGQFEMLRNFGFQISSMGDEVSLSLNGVTQVVEKTPEAIYEAVLSFGEVEGVMGSMADQAATLGGRLSNLQDNTDLLGNAFFEFAEGGLNTFYANLNLLLNGFNELEPYQKNLVFGLVSLAGAFATATSVIAGYTLAKNLGIIATQKKAAALVFETTASVASTVATTAYNLVMAASNIQITQATLAQAAHAIQLKAATLATGALTAAKGLFTTASAAATGASLKFMLVWAATPIGAATIALAGLTAGVIALSAALNEEANKAEVAMELSENFASAMEKLRGGTELTAFEFERLTRSIDQQVEAGELSELQAASMIRALEGQAAVAGLVAIALEEVRAKRVELTEVELAHQEGSVRLLQQLAAGEITRAEMEQQNLQQTIANEAARLANQEETLAIMLQQEEAFADDITQLRGEILETEDQLAQAQISLREDAEKRVEEARKREERELKEQQQEQRQRLENSHATELAELEAKNQQALLSEEDYAQQVFAIHEETLRNRLRLIEEEMQHTEAGSVERQTLEREAAEVANELWKAHADYRQALDDATADNFKEQRQRLENSQAIELAELEAKNQQAQLSEENYAQQVFAIHEAALRSRLRLIQEEIQHTEAGSVERQTLEREAAEVANELWSAHADYRQALDDVTADNFKAQLDSTTTALSAATQMAQAGIDRAQQQSSELDRTAGQLTRINDLLDDETLTANQRLQLEQQRREILRDLEGMGVRVLGDNGRLLEQERLQAEIQQRQIAAKREELRLSIELAAIETRSEQARLIGEAANIQAQLASGDVSEPQAAALQTQLGAIAQQFQLTAESLDLTVQAAVSEDTALRREAAIANAVGGAIPVAMQPLQQTASDLLLGVQNNSTNLQAVGQQLQAVNLSSSVTAVGQALDIVSSSASQTVQQSAISLAGIGSVTAAELGEMGRAFVVGTTTFVEDADGRIRNVITTSEDAAQNAVAGISELTDASATATAASGEATANSVVSATETAASAADTIVTTAADGVNTMVTDAASQIATITTDSNTQVLEQAQTAFNDFLLQTAGNIENSTAPLLTEIKGVIEQVGQRMESLSSSIPAAISGTSNTFIFQEAADLATIQSQFGDWLTNQLVQAAGA